MATRKRKAAEDTVVLIKKSVNELDEVFKAADKQYGVNTISTARDIIRPTMVSSGIFLLDLCTLGGIPQSRISQLAGVQHGGKTTCIAKIIKSAQKLYPDQIAVLVDVEQSSDTVWMEKLGVDVDRLKVARCDTGEDYIDLTDALIRSKEVSVVAVDSVAALTSTKEIEASSRDHTVAQQAGMVTRMGKAMTSAFSEERRRGHRPLIVATNQLRSDLNGYTRFGEATKTTGGKAWGHFLSLNVTLRNKEMAGKDQYGTDSISVNEHTFKVSKNKLCGGIRQGEFRMVRCHDPETGLDEGDFDNAPTMLVYAKRFGLYTGGGSSWKLVVGGKEYKVRKADDAKAILYEDLGIQWQLRNELIAFQALNLGMPTEMINSILATPNLL